jgi:hypothetical protein
MEMGRVRSERQYALILRFVPEGRWRSDDGGQICWSAFVAMASVAWMEVRMTMISVPWERR